jgi:hypothetical protein
MGSRHSGSGLPSLLSLLAGAAVTIAIGCDRRSGGGSSSSTGSDGGGSAVATTDAPAPATRPTTQQLLEGPTKRIGLVLVPLSVEAPESWQVKTLNLSADPQPSGQPAVQDPPMVGASSLTELVGPAPGGDVQVQLAQRLPWQGERLERMLKAAQRDAEAQQKAAGGGALLKFDIREQQGMRVMEQQKVLTPPDAGPKLLDWRITYFAPRRGSAAAPGAGAAAAAPSSTAATEYEACELNFLNLTVDQYERDRQFLQKIVDSVRYDPAAQTVAPPSMNSLDSLKPPER